MINKKLDDLINAYGLTNVKFFNEEYKDLNSLIELTTFKSIIFAGDGIYYLIRNVNFGHILSKLKFINYQNNKLKKINKEQELATYCNPKPDITLFEKIIQICQYAYSLNQCELTVDLYFNKTAKKYIINIPEQQVSGTASRYTSDLNFDTDKDLVKYLQIHSHASMEAFFSGTDCSDEKREILCFYGVIGNLNSDDISKKFRIWSGINFLNLKLKDVFMISENKNTLEKHYKNKIEKIIKSSKQMTKVQTKQFSELKDRDLWNIQIF